MWLSGGCRKASAFKIKHISLQLLQANMPLDPEIQGHIGLQVLHVNMVWLYAKT